MAEVIKTVLLNYSACALVGGVLEYIAPEKTRKTLRTVVVSLMLLAVASPIAKSEISLEDSLISREELSSNINYESLLHTANLTEKKIREEIKEILINQNINEYEIYITTDIDEAENIVFLTEIKIETEKAFEGKFEAVKNQIPEEYKEVLKIGVKNE